jgi:hypothetical protein
MAERPLSIRSRDLRRNTRQLARRAETGHRFSIERAILPTDAIIDADD